MAEIINLDELIPEDISVRYRGKIYKLPGDIDTESVFQLFELFRLLTTESKATGTKRIDELKERIDALNAKLLVLFQICDPKLTELPFGLRSMPLILRIILGQLGVDIAQDAEGNRSARRTSSRAQKKTGTRKGTGTRASQS